MTDDPAPGAGRAPRGGAWRSALRNTCPNCGDGRLLSGWLTPLDTCAVCGADFKPHAAGDGAVFIVLTILCFAAVGSVAGVELAFAPPAWVHVVIGVLVVGGLTALLLPPVKRFLIAQSFLMEAGLPPRAPDSSEDAP